ncbi:hypothetical protein EW146_g2136 [Bondarzewia mesenterica]|uniref:Uncharacterized protein n=1 Tax=Bondarzewia mesenterica TaxID=1095465 RepID=A0A4S4M1L0_9AGAM|nr:hypothetical protein EW146_g2136 [Bondarzewia mesenterica]
MVTDLVDLPTILASWYGFAWTGKGYSSADICGAQIPKTDWTTLRKVLGDAESPCPPYLQDPIADFYHLLCTSITQAMPNIPEALWDLGNSLEHPVDFGSLSVHRHQLSNLVLYTIESSTLGVHGENGALPWLLMVRDPAAVLWCVRVYPKASIPIITHGLLKFGPSDCVFETGDIMASGPRDQALWDDALSEDELDLICGVYQVYTEREDQVSHSSWWPKHSTWQDSGLDCGYWSPFCEVWFKNHFEDIMRGTNTIKTASQWANSLRYYKKPTAALVSANRAFAAKYLDGMRFS